MLASQGSAQPAPQAQPGSSAPLQIVGQNIQMPDGQQLDPRVKGDAARLIQEVEAHELTSILEQLQLKLQAESDGTLQIVEDDAYRSIDHQAELERQGPQDHRVEFDKHENRIVEALEKIGFRVPDNSAAHATAASTVRTHMQTSVAKLKLYFQTGSGVDLESFISHLQGDLVRMGKFANIILLVYQVLKESTREDQLTKRHILERMRDQNKIAQAFTEQLKHLNEVSMELSEAAKNQDEPHKVFKYATIARIDHGSLDSDGKPVLYDIDKRMVNPEMINAAIKDHEADHAQQRYGVQELTNRFRDLDTKTTDALNKLASLLKNALGSMRRSVSTNL